MKGILTGLLIAVLSLPGILYAGRGIDLKIIEEWQQHHTVVLQNPEGREFCSGGVVGNKIMTAAHCCAVMLWEESIEGYGYSFDGVTKKPIQDVKMDSRGNDVCMITPVEREYSPIKMGEFIVADPDRNVFAKDHFVINKISYIYDDPTLRYMEVQRIYRIGVHEDDTSIVIMQGEGMPGTSGSLILNSQGEYVGNLVIGLGTDRFCCIEHVFGVSQLELTEWGNTYW